jgi:hypothetical protein
MSSPWCDQLSTPNGSDKSTAKFFLICYVLFFIFYFWSFIVCFEKYVSGREKSKNPFS